MLRHTQIVILLNISKVKSQESNSSQLSSAPVTAGLVPLPPLPAHHFTHFVFCPFLTFCHFNSSGISGPLFRFIIAFAPPLGSFNLNDSLILCNKATIMNWQIKMAEYWSGFMSFQWVAEGPESLNILKSCLLAWVAKRQNCFSSALLCFLSCTSSYLTRMRVYVCVLVCVSEMVGVGSS